MSLLSRLFSLYWHRGASQQPEEDFFTEAVAYLFSIRPDLLLEWVRGLGILPPEYDHVTRVVSQQRYSALDHHRQGSRPDIVVSFESTADLPKRAVLFIESKLLSQEHGDQLRRYAEHLAALSNCDHRALLYLTREYDPKDMREVLGACCTTTVLFRQARWHELYRFLGKQVRDGESVEREVLEFMRERGMGQDNVFTAVDLLAMTHFHRALGLMKAVLDGEVKGNLETIAGRCGKASAPMKQLESLNRLILVCQGKGEAFWCGLGFYLGLEGAGDYPQLGLQIGVSPKSPLRPRMIAVLRELSNQEGFQAYNLSSERDWASVRKTISMRELLREEDHVSAMKIQFLALLEELKAIKQRYPDLPWNTGSATEVAGDGEVGG